MFITSIIMASCIVMTQFRDPVDVLNEAQAKRNAVVKARIAKQRSRAASTAARTAEVQQRKAITEKHSKINVGTIVLCTAPAIVSKDQSRFREFAALTGDPEAVAQKVNYLKDTVSERHTIDAKSVRGTAISQGQTKGLSASVSNGGIITGGGSFSQSAGQSFNRTDVGVDSINRRVEIDKRSPLELAEEITAIWPGDKAEVIRMGFDTVDIQIISGEKKGFKGTTSILIFEPLGSDPKIKQEKGE